MVTITAQQQYTLVDKTYHDRILHLNAVHSIKTVSKPIITAIPVFRTKQSAQQLKNEIAYKNKTNQWHISMDEHTNKSIFQAKLLANETYMNDTMCIKEIDFTNEQFAYNLINQNIAILYIDMFWYKNYNMQQVITGNLWLPHGYYSDNCDIDLAKHLLNEKYN